MDGVDLGRVPPDIDTSVAHGARVYDYWLGGKDNYAADRALGDAMAEQIPNIAVMARANRAFVGRAVRYLVAEAGIRQFLDIGTGIPSQGNVHEVAQEIAPETRVLYVDNDPIVLAHARALMAGDGAGRTAFIPADLRDPSAILTDPAVVTTLDFERPVALMLVAILMYFRDDDDPYGIVATLVDALPSGSYVAISHPTPDFAPEAVAGVAASAEAAGIPFVPRGREDTQAFFAGLEMVEPGLAPVAGWHPDHDVDPYSAYYWAGIGRKP